MSLPSHVSLGDDNFLNLQNYGSDPDFLYFSSLKETVGVCEKSIQHDVKELNLNTPFESFNQTVEFQESALEKLREKSIKQIDQQVHTFIKSLKNQISEYHFRNSIQINHTLKNKSQNSFALVEDFGSEIQKIKDCALDQWNFTKLKGNNPSKWPFDLNDFIKDIKKQPLLSQFNEPEFFNQEFAERVKQVIRQNLNVLQDSDTDQKSRKASFDLIIDSTIAIFYVNFNRGSFEDLVNSSFNFMNSSEYYKTEKWLMNRSINQSISQSINQLNQSIKQNLLTRSFLLINKQNRKFFLFLLIDYQHKRNQSKK